MASKTITVPEAPQPNDAPSYETWDESPPSRASTPPEVPGHRILGYVASGGMGVVYAAISLASGRKVALKLLQPERHDDGAIERIRREIRVLSALSHPGIVEYIDHGLTEDGTPYLAMEWLDGIDLETRLRAGALSLEDTLALAIRVSEALAVAHEHGVIHRDIKPANIFLVGGRPENARLLDFGVARLSTRTRTLTLPGRIVGTPAYMSPEQARGGAEIDARADLFSLGCVLHECLSGEPAFAGEQVIAVLAKVLMEDPPRLGELVPELPIALEELVGRLLEKDPRRRIDRAERLAHRLRSLADGQGEPLTAMPEALTRDLQTLRSVLFLRGRPEPGTAPADLVQLAEEHLGEHVTLADGTRLIVMDRGGVASDHAAAAARCALALHERAPYFAIGVASGLGLMSGRLIMGQVLDRGAELLLRARPGRIRIDEVTASLLDASFDVDDDDVGLVLLAVHDVLPGARRLMGKATPLVGRNRELAFLEAGFDECIEERCAAAVVVIAEAGAGKSRLHHELDARLRARHGPAMTSLIARADPMRAQAPLSLLARALYGAASLEDGEPAHVRRHKLRARLSRHLAAEDVDRVTLYLGELVSAFPNDAPLELQLAREDSATLRSRIQTAWCTWLRAESEANPVLFVLEDLHWADAATVQVMDVVLDELQGSAMLVLALARPSVHQRFPSLWKQREVELLELPPLSLRAARMLVHQVLGPEAQPADVERIVNGARGNAFFLEELIRAVANRAGDELPDSVLGMMQARLAALPAPDRQVLRAASVFGATAWRGGIRELLGRDTDTAVLEPILARLVEAEWLIPHPCSQIPCEDEYRFRHALVRDAAYTTLTSVDRRVGHRLAGRWLERAEGQEAVVLAEHFQRGEDHAKATAWFATAADQAFERHELDVVLQLVERGMKGSVPGEHRGRLLQRQAEVCAGTGQHQEAARAAWAALEELPADSPRWYVAAGEAALAMGRAGQTARVLQIVDQLMEIEPVGVAGAINFVKVARAVMPLAVVGRGASVERLLDKIERLTSAFAGEDPDLVGFMHAARALRAVVAGSPYVAYRELLAATEAFNRAGSLRHELEHSGGAGFFLLELGGMERGEAILRQTIERSSGLEHVSAVARHNLGRRVAETGRIEEGLALEREAFASFERHGNHRMMGLTQCHIAWIMLLAGRADEAAVHADMAVELLQGQPASVCLAHATRARIRLAASDVERALEDATVAIEGLQGLDQVLEGESLIRLTWAETLAAVGRADEALVAIVEARRNLEERAASVDDEELRGSFLSEVPENARIMRLAREWGPP
jgi:tetratricopeptide (TPR) repeat protein